MAWEMRHGPIKNTKITEEKSGWHYIKTCYELEERYKFPLLDAGCVPGGCECPFCKAREQKRLLTAYEWKLLTAEAVMSAMNRSLAPTRALLEEKVDRFERKYGAWPNEMAGQLADARKIITTLERVN